MGLVLAAHHEPLDRMVALKVLRRESAKDPVMVERFLREARAAANLKSEHVTRVLDVGTLPTGAPFMVLEYLEGADLAHVITRHGRLAVGVACNYVVQACAAVAEAHANGIVHRDLKPDNLYLTTSLGGADLVKVLDFGVSKVMNVDRAVLTTTGTTVGSPVYMAPEQVRGSRDVGPRADVWALGVVLYELLTESLPFEAESLPDLCLQIANDPPRPLQSRRADVPAGLAAVVARCLEKDPAKRYFDAAELAEALAPFAESIVRSTASGPQPSIDPQAITMPAPPIPGYQRPRHRVLGWIGAAALAAGVAGAWLAQSTPPDARVALAAADAAMSASFFAQPSTRLEPEATPPSATPLPPAPASSVSTPAPLPVPLPAVSPHVSPVSARAPRPVPAPASSTGDDIPAFR